MEDGPTLRGAELEELSRSLDETRQAMDAWLGSVRSAEGGEEGKGAELLSRLQDATRLVGAAVGRLCGREDFAGGEPPVPPPFPEPPSPPEPSSGLSGRCETISIPDLLDFLANQRKTGVLRVAAERERFLLQLHEGTVVFAQGDDPPEGLQLGEVLVTIGALSRSELDHVMETPTDRPQRLGVRLLAEARVTEEDLRTALAYQTRRIFDRLFAAVDATFAFSDGERVLEQLDVRFNVMQLLLDSARVSDESATASGNWLDVPVPDEWQG